MGKRGRKIWAIVGSVLFWGCVVAFFVWATLLRKTNEAERRVERVEVIVRDSDRHNFVTTQRVLTLIEDAGLNPTGKRVDSVVLEKINRAVEDYCFTLRAMTYVDYDGTLTVELTQRIPYLRVATNDGHDFYLTRDLYLLPIEPSAAPNLPIVTGELELPFGKSFKGDLKEWLLGGEKKYKDCYNFLCKLINFVGYTEREPEVGDDIVQIVCTAPKRGGSEKGFVEPDVELVPRYGNYIVELGRLDDVEEKIYRWRRFVEAGVVDMSAGGVLSVEYDKQALWKAPKAKAEKKKSKK